MVMATAVREVVGPLAEQAAAGDLTVHVADVLPFEQAVTGSAPSPLATPAASSSSPSTTDRSHPRAGPVHRAGPAPSPSDTDHPYPLVRDEDKS